MRQKNQALVDAMETQGYDAKGIAQKIGVTLPAVYNWIRGGKPRQPQRAKLTGLLGIDIVEAAGQVERETRAAAFQAGHAEREKRAAAMAAGYEARRAEANDVEIIDTPEAPTVPFKINGAPKTNGVHPAPAKPISVRVSGDGLLVEVQVKHDTAMEVLEALGFRMGISSDWDEPSAPTR